MVKLHCYWYWLLKGTVTTLLSDLLYEPVINNCTKYDALQNAISKSTRLSHCEWLRLDSCQPAKHTYLCSRLVNGDPILFVKKGWCSHMHAIWMILVQKHCTFPEVLFTNTDLQHEAESTTEINYFMRWLFLVNQKNTVQPESLFLRVCSCLACLVHLKWTLVRFLCLCNSFETIWTLVRTKQVDRDRWKYGSRSACKQILVQFEWNMNARTKHPKKAKMFNTTFFFFFF